MTDLNKKKSNDCVVLLHGIARSSKCMRHIERKLLSDDYKVLNKLASQ